MLRSTGDGEAVGLGFVHELLGHSFDHRSENEPRDDAARDDDQNLERNPNKRLKGVLPVDRGN